MLQTLFYIGVLTPAAIVVLLFVIFLICWFKCNLRERIYQKIGRGHNSTQSSLADTKDYLSCKTQPRGRRENLDNEDNESRCGSVQIMDHNVVKYNRGEFPYMKRESWRYMSTKSVSKCREEILREKVFPPLPPIWTTAADSSSSLDSETAVSMPWLPPEGKVQGNEHPRDSQMWNNDRHCGRNRNSIPRLSVDQSPVNNNTKHGPCAEILESSSDTLESLGTSPAIHRENTASRPLYFTPSSVTSSPIHQVHTPQRNYNYNQKTLNEKIPDKSYELFLNDTVKDNRLQTGAAPGCQKQLLLDSQDLGASTDVDKVYLSVMPNIRAPIVSV